MPVQLYGVVRDTGSPLQTLGSTGRGDDRRRGGPLRCVSGTDLCAVVGDTDDADAPRSRDDLLTYAHVLESLAEETAVIPVQFGTIAPDDDAIRRDVLDQQHDDLVALLDVFADVVQVTVDVRHREDAALREVLLRDPDLVVLRDQVRTPSAGQADKVRLGEAVSMALDELRRQDAALVLDRLAPHAHAVAENEPRGVDAVSNVAFLVDRDHVPMDEAVTRLGEQLGGRAQVRYVGPQPPYSFLEPVVSGELAWA